MTEAEQIAEFLAKKGVTRCPPGWAAETSNATPATQQKPARKTNRRFSKHKSQVWAYRL